MSIQPVTITADRYEALVKAEAERDFILTEANKLAADLSIARETIVAIRQSLFEAKATADALRQSEAEARSVATACNSRAARAEQEAAEANAARRDAVIAAETSARDLADAIHVGRQLKETLDDARSRAEAMLAEVTALRADHHRLTVMFAEQDANQTGEILRLQRELRALKEDFQ